jgi:hypothetical protein
MFFAALRSRSWTVPHAVHVQERTCSGLGPSSTPQAEQTCEVGVNRPTKRHWRGSSRLEDIVSGLAYLHKHARSWGITSLAVPALGCGLGGLSWERVWPLLETELARLGIPVFIYKPR